eukprot:GHVU01076455.1.p1 GENE.GHVU01076455.1~~GHVU01076455.1.p1  ORF type:complete len:402 (+),score=35.93 GHVU01076455.1:1227-2432(+)
MAIWGKVSNAESRPKSLPMDSNSSYSREFVTANAKGWVFQPGTASAATGNDNASADPEILVAIRNLSVTTGSANLLSIDYTSAELADTGEFDLILSFDEPVSVTSADITATPNQTVTNKAYILLSRLGGTDMVEDSTVLCAYLTAAGAAAADGDRGGSGTNTLTFRGKLQSADAGFLSFTDGYIHLNGTSTLKDPESGTLFGLRDETLDDSILLDGSDGTVVTINGAITTASTTVTINTLVGDTIAVGQVVTVKSGAASITDDAGDTGVSTDMTLTITAVASQTVFTVSEKIIVADDVILNLQTSAGDKVEVNAASVTLEGADGATDVTGTEAYRTGFGVDTIVGRVEMLEDSSGKILSETDGEDGISAEEFTTDAAGLIVVTQAGSTSGSASILNGITTL